MSFHYSPPWKAQNKYTVELYKIHYIQSDYTFQLYKVLRENRCFTRKKRNNILLSIIWLTIQGETTQNINKFTLGVLAGFPATMFMLFVIYFALKQSVPLALAIALGVVAWGIFSIASSKVHSGSPFFHKK